MTVYLDHHATTPTDPRVLAAMLPYFTEQFGNPSGLSHSYGLQAGDALEAARQQVATFVGAKRDEIVFTSGATESNNIALLGTARRWTERFGQREKPLIFLSDAEHPSIAIPAQWLESDGFGIERISLDSQAEMDIPDLVCRLRANAQRTLMVCMQLANSETGTIYPVAEIGAVCHELHIAFHVDATQAPLWLPIDVNAFHATTLALSAHKMHGPKGTGILFIRHDPDSPTLTPTPLMGGGSQENGMRPGTQNLPAIIGTALACRLAAEERTADGARVAGLRDELARGLTVAYPDAVIHGTMQHRLPNNLSIGFPCLPQLPHPFAYYLTDIAVSATSACCSGHHASSKLLAKIGVSQALARNSLRMGLGRFTTEDEIQIAIAIIVQTINKFRHQAL